MEETVKGVELIVGAKNDYQFGPVLLTGIGGTGVVTVNQIIATAAMLDGKYSSGLDQTGLAQKGGPVVSNLRITVAEQDDLITGSNRVGDGAADALLAFDLVTATKNLQRAAPDRTTAVVGKAESTSTLSSRVTGDVHDTSSTAVIDPKRLVRVSIWIMSS